MLTATVAELGAKNADSRGVRDKAGSYSVLSFAEAANVVSHCMYSGRSDPPHFRGTTAAPLLHSLKRPAAYGLATKAT